MPLSWNEIRHRAIAFSKEWEGVSSERAEKQTYWNEFFNVFGISRRAVASFEAPVKKFSGHWGSIDLFWKRTLLVEHKSAGGHLGVAQSQAFDYVQALINEGRLEEAPRYVIVSDFARIALHDLEADEQKGLPLFAGRRVQSLPPFHISTLHEHIHDFAFIPGYKQHKFEEQDPINIEAVEILGRLHDALETGGYSGHQLERFLVRILFCLFAEDTGIFEREAFRLYLENRTAPDGSDLGLHLARLFDVLDTPPEKRQKNLDEALASFPYVNGDLYAERLGFADFNAVMRHALLACCQFDWSRISPAIFGSLFQAVMEPRERRQIGGHYTSERDILKLIRSLFLDDLWAEFQRAKSSKTELKRFHDKLAALRFLDPACGCGNFLVVTYRELRLLELELLTLYYGLKRKEGQQVFEIDRLSLLDVDQFYGIEISEWPARIAEVALWLMDHQMNQRLSETFGELLLRLPLKKSPRIIVANALRTDWKSVLATDKCSYVLGNPPFVGKKEQSADQKKDMDLVFADLKGSGLLDYVCAWYLRAAQYIDKTQIAVAFVSTNSITQGEQVGVLWSHLLSNFKLHINFAHRTFSWESEARGKAHVHVVIIGFAAFADVKKTIFEYAETDGEPHAATVSRVSPYLVESDNVLLVNRSKPITDCPAISYGSFALDDGHYTLSVEDREAILRECPTAERFIKPFLGGQELLHGLSRFCLWLRDAKPGELAAMPAVLRRVDAVRKWRESRGRETTRNLATTPALFAEIRQPTSDYLALPTLSSVRRRYVPIAYLPPTTIASNQLYVLATATSWHFGVLHSSMHMAWVRQVGGRFKSDYRYSASLVYNNFPWPVTPNEKQRAAVLASAQALLDCRKQFPTSTLAELYDPLTMPPELVKAHGVLDRAVDFCYRSQPFDSDRQRVEFLFVLYENLIAPLTTPSKKSRKTRRTNNEFSS